MDRVYRVGGRGEDRIVVADSPEDAVRKANEQARAEHKEWRRRHGNAPSPVVYGSARKVRFVDGIEEM